MCIEIFEMFGASFILITLLMTTLWFIATFKQNAGIVDIGWAISFFIAIWAYFLLGDGFWLKRLLLTAMVSAWSLRLAWYIGKRFDFSVEDPRYTDLKESLGAEMSDFKMFLMFLFQGFLVIVLTIPFAIVAGYSTSTWHPLEGLGILIWAGGFAGQYYADQQLENFKRNPANEGKVCNAGLWKYSRHPNYFFEWVIWIGYFFFAFPSPWGWLALISPVLMLIFLTRVSGIPPAERQALKTKGDAYREYMEITSPFVPLPPKKG